MKKIVKTLRQILSVKHFIYIIFFNVQGILIFIVHIDIPATASHEL